MQRKEFLAVPEFKKISGLAEIGIRVISTHNLLVASIGRRNRNPYKKSMRLLKFPLDAGDRTPRFHAAILLCLLAWGGSGPVIAADTPEAFTGQEMLGYCKSLELDQKQDFDRGICVGFLDGFIAGHQVAEHYHAFHHRDEKIDAIYGRLCIPPKTTRGQMAKLFVRYMEQFPDKLKSSAGNLLEEAIQEAYPCPEKVPPKPN